MTRDPEMVERARAAYDAAPIGSRHSEIMADFAAAEVARAGAGRGRTDATCRAAVEAAFPVGSKVRIVSPLRPGMFGGTDGRPRNERFPVGSIETVAGYDELNGEWRLLVKDNKGWALECADIELCAPHDSGEVAALRAEVERWKQAYRDRTKEHADEMRRAERAEAEVARLRDELGIAKRNADYFEREYVDLLHRYTRPTPAAPGLDALRARFIDACAEICIVGNASPFDAARYDLADKEYDAAAAEIVAAKAAIAQRAAAKEVK